MGPPPLPWPCCCCGFPPPLFDPSGEAVLWLDGDCQTILSQKLLQPPLDAEIEGGSFRRDRRYLPMGSPVVRVRWVGIALSVVVSRLKIGGFVVYMCFERCLGKSEVVVGGGSCVALRSWKGVDKFPLTPDWRSKRDNSSRRAMA